MRNAPTLTTDRLAIRPISLDDWEDYCTAWADARMTAFIGGTPRDRATSWIKFLQAAGMWPVLGFGYWTFADRQTGRWLGTGGLARMERGISQLEGFPEAGWAFSSDSWGRGFATEAIAAILTWSDSELKAPEVRCIIDPGNAPSIRVAEKTGFTRIDETEDEQGSLLIFARRRP